MTFTDLSTPDTSAEQTPSVRGDRMLVSGHSRPGRIAKRHPKEISMSKRFWTLSATLGLALCLAAGFALMTPDASVGMAGFCCDNGDCLCGFRVMTTPVLSDDGPTCQSATWRLASKLEAYAPSVDGYCFQEFDFEECRPNTMGSGYWISGSMRYKTRTCP